MELIKKMRIFLFAALLGTMVSFITTSCDDDNDESANYKYGVVTGTVTDEAGTPIEGVTVTISGLEETVTTDANGKYSVENVSVETHSVTFSKAGWETISVTVTAKSFGAELIANASASMLDASAKIVGTVFDARNQNAPFEGVTVSISPTLQVTTGSDGKYVIENLREADYTVTFSKEGYTSITRQVSKDSFIEGTFSIADVMMGRVELLRNLTADDLATADKWYYNEYRGGRNADAYPHWDWACDYMCTLSFMGDWDEQNEGTTLRIRNSGNDQKNPADLEVFDSYVYGSKLISEDNKIMSLRVRTHDASAESPAYFGVQVVDLSETEPSAVKIGDTKTLASGDYTDFDFDLSQYVGKEVIIAIGTYRQATGDYWKQLVLRSIRFANTRVEEWNWLPGTEVVEGWKLTQETVRSTMPHTKKSFTGISPISGNRDNYKDAYRAWRNVAHIASEWSLIPLKKDPEVFPSEGYILKTNDKPEVSSEIPEAYLYSKFSIMPGSNKLTFKTRNFSSNYTYFKLTAIENNGTVTHLSPSSNTAQDAKAAEDGCWKFTHQAGGSGEPDKYASFVYDLSKYNGKDVTIVIGVYNVEPKSGENKLVFYNVDLK